MSLNIACDEAGYTGPDLLNKDQRYFVFASVNIENDEAWNILSEARKQHKVQMPELKSSLLLKSNTGRRLVADVILASKKRYAINAHDKVLALCGWIFEYIYEPVFQENPRLLYQKNLHRFVAMFCWAWFISKHAEANEAIVQFQKYMRSKSTADAPLFFSGNWPPLSQNEKPDPFNLILRFATGYKKEIQADNSNLTNVLPDGGKWVLDLSICSLWSHLNYWGKNKIPLAVNCDANKPLIATTPNFRGDHLDPAIARAKHLGLADQLGWELSRPIAFVDSRDQPAVQLADIIAGTVLHIHTNGFGDDLEEISQHLTEQTLRDSIFPDSDIIDLSQREAAVNYLVLFDLAQRAERNANPYSKLAELYQAAESTWRPGLFK